jgi:hypothetical protein
MDLHYGPQIWTSILDPHYGPPVWTPNKDSYFGPLFFVTLDTTWTFHAQQAWAAHIMLRDKLTLKCVNVNLLILATFYEFKTENHFDVHAL